MTTQSFVVQVNNQPVTVRIGDVVVPNIKVTGGVAGRPGIDGADGTTAVVTHINDATPHSVYDDMNDLALIFENGLV